jgi:hypothetical protein
MLWFTQPYCLNTLTVSLSIATGSVDGNGCDCGTDNGCGIDTDDGSECDDEDNDGNDCDVDVDDNVVGF